MKVEEYEYKIQPMRTNGVGFPQPHGHPSYVYATTTAQALAASSHTDAGPGGVGIVFTGRHRLVEVDDMEGDLPSMMVW